MTYQELAREYKRLAKTADQRLVRLERYSEQTHYKGVKSYSYAKAQHALSEFYKVEYNENNQLRFNTKLPTNYQELQGRFNKLKEFLDSPTSTKQGITNMYKKRAQTTNERYGTNFTWQELANYYEGEEFEKIDSTYKASKTVMKALASIRKVGPDPERIQEVIEKHTKVSSDDVVNEIAVKLLKEGYTFDDLFK